MVVEAMESQLTTTFCAFKQVAARNASASETASRVVFNLSLLERQVALPEGKGTTCRRASLLIRDTRRVRVGPQQTKVDRAGKSVFTPRRKQDWSWGRPRLQSGRPHSPPQRLSHTLPQTS